MTIRDLPLPALVLRESALAHNLGEMAAWCRRNGFELAPHGKTTMCPQIFRRQLAAGAWGITVATSEQALVCADSGTPRILVANQLVGPANIRSLAQAELAAELYCLIDSLEALECLNAHWQGPARLNVFIELGRWRTGLRSTHGVLDLYRALESCAPRLQFAGLEMFEGSAATQEEAEQFLNEMVSFAASFPVERAIFSAGGSAYLPAVMRALRQLPSNWMPLLRSGCYVTHDHGIYETRQNANEGQGGPVFQPALELWAHVQSIPEPDLAILGFGKRDCSYDLGLPRPLGLPGAEVTALNDQHAYLRLPDGAGLRVSDAVRLGISHPCTAFDKWRRIPLIDDDGNIRDWYSTHFHADARFHL